MPSGIYTRTLSHKNKISKTMKLLFSKKLLKNKKIYGEANGQHKVTVHEVREIREMYENRNYTQRGLGRLFGIGKTTVWSIVNYKTWK